MPVKLHENFEKFYSEIFDNRHAPELIDVERAFEAGSATHRAETGIARGRAPVSSDSSELCSTEVRLGLDPCQKVLCHVVQHCCTFDHSRCR